MVKKKTKIRRKTRWIIRDDKGRIVKNIPYERRLKGIRTYKTHLRRKGFKEVITIVITSILFPLFSYLLNLGLIWYILVSPWIAISLYYALRKISA